MGWAGGTNCEKCGVRPCPEACSGWVGVGAWEVEAGVW